MQKYYKAEMDRFLRVSTRMVKLFYLLPPAVLIFVWYKARHSIVGRHPPPFLDKFLGLALLLFSSLMAVTAYVTRSMAPRGYALNDVELLIDRAMKPIKIPLREILEVSVPEDGLLRRSLRLMGASGYYGYYGLFWNSKLGRYRAYVTRTTDLLAVRTEKGLFVLSPDDTKDFRAALTLLIRK
jgi:hypothetical protein